MRWAKPGAFYQLRLEPGEDVLPTLVEFVRARGIGSGIISGIGAADNIELGLYDLKGRVYRRRTFRGDHEILALSGNVAWDGRDPVCHVHCVISDAKIGSTHDPDLPALFECLKSTFKLREEE